MIRNSSGDKVREELLSFHGCQSLGQWHDRHIYRTWQIRRMRPWRRLYARSAANSCLLGAALVICIIGLYSVVVSALLKVMLHEVEKEVLINFEIDPHKLTRDRFQNMISLGAVEAGSYVVDEQGNTTMCSLNQRTQYLREMCTNAGRTPLKSLEGVPEEDLPNHLLVDDKHGILYCDLAKVGSTTWLTLFAFASGMADHYQQRKWIPGHSDKALLRYNLRRLRSYEPDERRKRLESYVKFIVVRHPYDRLLAAWRNKFLQKNFYTKQVAPGIIKTYRQQGVDLGNFVTFDEFIQHVLHEGALSDPHWLTYESCKPCLIDYDYISRTETMQQDDKLMKLLLGVDRLDLTPKHVLAPEDLYKTRKTLAQFKNISEHHMNKLNDMYGADLRLFGYHFDKHLREASCEFEGKKCC